MANNPKHHGGATDVAAGNKVMRLIQLCDTFHLPLISFADEPGFMVGLESEKNGIERAGARLVARWRLSRMPWAPSCRPAVRRRRPVPPPPDAACSAAMRGRRRTGVRCTSPAARAPHTGAKSRMPPDPAKSAREIEARLRAIASPFRTAEATGQDIIDPRNTRALLCEFVDDAQRILRDQLGLPRIPYLP